ncbi:MAG: hypothetical protein J7K29_05690 [Candidatus Cloacimonetes bacterium]|nr:hypothetical protein [Candidatus Cloacimonadota bacterium]
MKKNTLTIESVKFTTKFNKRNKIVNTGYFINNDFSITFDHPLCDNVDTWIADGNTPEAGMTDNEIKETRKHILVSRSESGIKKTNIMMLDDMSKIMSASEKTAVTKYRADSMAIIATKNDPLPNGNLPIEPSLTDPDIISAFHKFGETVKKENIDIVIKQIMIQASVKELTAEDQYKSDQYSLYEIVNPLTGSYLSVPTGRNLYDNLEGMISDEPMADVINAAIAAGIEYDAAKDLFIIS